jgi:pyruvate, water dikinase
MTTSSDRRSSSPPAPRTGPERAGRLVLNLDQVTLHDVALVGGKNASLGEMIGSLQSAGIRVPPGFATTAAAYWRFLDENDLRPFLAEELGAFERGERTLPEVGRTIRRRLRAAPIPDGIQKPLLAAYHELCQRVGLEHASVAVRSSATAEDLPDASFAGQQETFLNVSGDAELLEAWRACIASLFTDRAIVYRKEKGFDHLKVALSVGVQKMVRSDLASSGVMFTLDTETGFPNVITISSSWGLGENIVQGAVNPDEITVFKPALADPAKRPILRKLLGAKEKTMIFSIGGTRSTKNIDTPLDQRRRFSISDDEILQLARWAVRIEEHNSKHAKRHAPMDIEWAKDGETGDLFIVQARPETVHALRSTSGFVSYKLEESGEVLAKGRSIGDAIAAAPVSVVKEASQLARFKPGSILVAEMTDPDWVPIMRSAAGIVTDHGGRTCHAAIVARELGIPAIVGTSNGTQVLKDGDMVTMSCAGGEEGLVFQGALRFTRQEIAPGELPTTRTKIMMNLADPASAFQWWRLPTDGIGLARIEFIITDEVRVHPMALLDPERVAPEAQREIDELTRHYPERSRFFVETLARGIGMLAASQHPRPVIVRMSDFKTNEYANLLGGKAFEGDEPNPMIGFRGASRYYSDRYREGFALECRAIRMVREEIGLDNVVVMIPFCRTLEEADRVLDVMAENGLRRGERGLQVYVMCEIPSNVILATEFAQRFDGFSIGSNDLTQLTLGVDRDAELLAHLFDERNPAVVTLIRDVITKAHAAGRPVGICGQAPSDYPEFAGMLVQAGIDSISLNPDSVLGAKRRVAEAEARVEQRPEQRGEQRKSR